MWFDLSVILDRDGCDPGSGLRIEIAAHIDVGLCFAHLHVLQVGERGASE